MSLPEGELKGEEEGTVCEDPIGRGGFRGVSSGDVQHEFGAGSAICGGGPRDDGEDKKFRAEPSQKETESSKLKAESKKPLSFDL